jgi:hypothetical protein
MTVTTISKDARLITFVNVFTVEPVNQQRLVDLLARFTDKALTIAMFESGMYEVVETIAPPDRSS